jgi:hypothetical protein
MQQQPISQSYGANLLPKEYVEQELADISVSNKRIREELEEFRVRPAEIPRSALNIEEQTLPATTSYQQQPPQQQTQVFGAREGFARKIWGLEEQIKEDLGEGPSLAPPSPFESAATIPTQFGQYESQPPAITESTADVVVEEYRSGWDEYAGVAETPNVIAITSIQYEEFSIPTTTSFIPETTPYVGEAITTPTSTTNVPSSYKQPIGLNPLHIRTKPTKRVIDIFYDKNSMFTWNSNATVFARWLKTCGVFHEGDLVRHLTFSSDLKGVLNARELARNEDILRAQFPDQYPFWLEYFAHNIPFEIIFLPPQLDSIRKEVEEYHPALLLCPTLPDAKYPLNNLLINQLKNVSVMFAN